MSRRPPAGVDLGAADSWLTGRLLQGGAGARPERLFHLALRTGSPAAVEVLAAVATRGAESAELLRRRVLADRGVRPGLAGLSRREVRALAAVAMVWAGSMRDAEELEAAALIFSSLWDEGRTESLIPAHHLVAAQTLFLAGHHATLTRLLPEFTQLRDDAAHYLRTDLLNPFAAAPVDAPAASERASAPWLRLFGQLFSSAGLAPATVRPAAGEGPAFDLLDAPGPAAGSVGGELVTVVMPCYRPDPGLLTSVRSITAQTWGDLEIVIVDDASGPEYDELFQQAVASDPRARLLRMPRNGGSYLGREAAIARSTGSLVTFQDADDWSHPERIEQQVAVLRRQGAPMSRSHAVRAKDDLTHQWLGYRPVRPNASSLLVRRDVLDRCGGFVPVRKGADSEFAERISLLAGPIADTWTPLAITRLRSGSLSRGDFTYSWSAPDRLAFRDSFMGWHRQLAARHEAGEDVTVSTQMLHGLPFPVPPAWVRDLDGALLTPTHLPVTYLGSFADSVQPSAAMQWLQQQLCLAADRGDDALPPVGLWHHEAQWPKDRRRPRMSQAWVDLMVSTRGARRVTRVDPVRIDRLVVVDPGVLSLMTETSSAPSVADVEVWLTPEVVEPSVSLLPEDLLGISDVVASLCGQRPRWALAPFLSQEQQDFVVERLPGLQLHPALGDPTVLSRGAGAHPPAVSSAASDPTG